MKGLMGRKLGMTQVFTSDGTLIPVTVVKVFPNVVTQKKTMENDGYVALQLGMEDLKEHRATKANKGHAAKANTAPKRFYREIKSDEMADLELGTIVTADLFQAGDKVDVQEHLVVKVIWAGFTVITRNYYLPPTVPDLLIERLVH